MEKEQKKKAYLKRMGQIYALSIQNGYTEEELFNYTEKVFGFLYKKSIDKKKDKGSDVQ